MGPEMDEGGRSMVFDDHRLLFIEMDKFTLNGKFYSRPKPNDLKIESYADLKF